MTDAERASLRDAIEAVGRAAPPLVEWKGGQRLADGAIQMPFPVYHPAIDELIESLEQAHAVVNFDWMNWEGARGYRSASDVRDAPVEDAARLITTFVRGERFADGTLAAAIADGRLLAAAQRIVDG